MSFPKKTIYTCSAGYTLDGKRNSATSFEVNCNDDKNFEGETECKPIECGTIKNVNDSTADKAQLVFPKQTHLGLEILISADSLMQIMC